ncbi:MAG: Tyrosine recombinase XerC [Holosporales bacterium]
MVPGELLLKRLNMPGELSTLSPHQLRHTFCKNLVDARVSLEKVASLAGHERLDTTKLYCHPSLADLSGPPVKEEPFWGHIDF